MTELVPAPQPTKGLGGPTYIRIAAAVAVGIVIGVALSRTSERTPEIPVARMISAENSIKALRSEFDKLQESRAREAVREVMNDASVVRLNVSSQSYARLETDMGVFLVMVENVEPYADGQRITLAIGNPFNADFVGFKGLFVYGNPTQSKEESFTSRLRAGAWSRVNVILPRLPANQLDSINFSMAMNSVALR